MLNEFLPKINKRVTVIVFIGIILLLIITLFWKIFGTSTKDNANPETLYKNDNTIDFLVYHNTAYVNAATTDWISELKLTPNEYVGMIQRTNIQKEFREFDATKLDKGIKVYSTIEREDILLVFVNNQYIPYYQYIEG